MNIPTRVAEL